MKKSTRLICSKLMSNNNLSQISLFIISFRFNFIYLFLCLLTQYTFRFIKYLKTSFKILNPFVLIKVNFSYNDHHSGNHFKQIFLVYINDNSSILNIISFIPLNK